MLLELQCCCCLYSIVVVGYRKSSFSSSTKSGWAVSWFSALQILLNIKAYGINGKSIMQMCFCHLQDLKTVSQTVQGKQEKDSRTIN